MSWKINLCLVWSEVIRSASRLGDMKRKVILHNPIVDTEPENKYILLMLVAIEVTHFICRLLLYTLQVFIYT